MDHKLSTVRTASHAIRSLTTPIGFGFTFSPTISATFRTPRLHPSLSKTGL